jgi:hypothetical protein
VNFFAEFFGADRGRHNSIEAAMFFFYEGKIPQNELNVKLLQEHGQPPVGHSIGAGGWGLSD